MAPKLDHSPRTNTVDLTGLPEPVVEQVQRIVQEAREQQVDTLKVSAAIPRKTPTYISDPNPTPEEFMRILDEMATMGNGVILPADFSRADIYDDHD
jgi:hypothetical protein